MGLHMEKKTEHNLWEIDEKRQKELFVNYDLVVYSSNTDRPAMNYTSTWIPCIAPQL